MSDAKSGIRDYVIGYIGALVLTCGAFAAVHWQSADATATLAIVFALALMQAAVHFRFFLHVTLKKSSRDHLVLMLFSSIIVISMVAGTLVILLNLRHRMM
jgi:cytochrome o ubiquinol oxidase operon protein cyoD